MLESSESVVTEPVPSARDGAQTREADELGDLRRALAQRTRQLEASEATCMEVMEAHRRQSELLAMAAHDLRSPLSAIIGYADLLQMGVIEGVPPTAQEFVSRIRTSAQQVQILLDHLIAD